MSIATFVFLGIFATLFLYAVTLYNNFVRLKHNVAQAWSNIDVLLKQRHDELPKLVEACRQLVALQYIVAKHYSRYSAQMSDLKWLSGIFRPRYIEYPVLGPFNHRYLF